jgi:hypothetical protein
VITRVQLVLARPIASAFDSDDVTCRHGLRAITLIVVRERLLYGKGSLGTLTAFPRLRNVNKPNCYKSPENSAQSVSFLHFKPSILISRRLASLNNSQPPITLKMPIKTRSKRTLAEADPNAAMSTAKSIKTTAKSSASKAKTNLKPGTK